jgi:prepilin-type N-terminal cleavage/methylation domain-containing protein
MAKVQSTARLKNLWFKQRQFQHRGFTLIELLVSIAIGGIIVVALLGLVVELTDTNQKDAARTATQREMQAALDYIARDLREAVYVYDGTCLSTGANNISSATAFASSCPKLTDHLPEKLSTGGRFPALAFWRVDALPQEVKQRCRADFKATTSGTPTPPTNTSEPRNPLNTTPCLSGRTYTLVVYGIADNSTANNPSGVWKGRARLERYALAQYNSGGGLIEGYHPPLQSPNAKFIQWPYEKGEGTSAVPVNQQAAFTTRPTKISGRLQTLVDFVDDSGGAYDASANSFIEPKCPNPDPIAITSASLVEKINVISPAAAAFSSRSQPIRSFYACVRGETIGVQDSTMSQAEKDILRSEQSVNQEVLLVLTGSVSGRPGFPKRGSALEDARISTPASRLTPLQTRVLVRGAIRKNP